MLLMTACNIKDPLRNRIIVSLRVAWLSWDGAEPAQAADAANGNQRLDAAVARTGPFVERAAFFWIRSHWWIESRPTIFTNLTQSLFTLRPWQDLRARFLVEPAAAEGLRWLWRSAYVRTVEAANLANLTKSRIALWSRKKLWAGFLIKFAAFFSRSITARNNLQGCQREEREEEGREDFTGGIHGLAPGKGCPMPERLRLIE